MGKVPVAIAFLISPTRSLSTGADAAIDLARPLSCVAGAAATGWRVVACCTTGCTVGAAAGAATRDTLPLACCGFAPIESTMSAPVLPQSVQPGSVARPASTATACTGVLLPSTLIITRPPGGASPTATPSRLIEKPGEPASISTGSPRRITGSALVGASMAGTARAAGASAGRITGTKMRQSGPVQDTTTASCASLRQASETVGHCARRSRASIAVRAPPSAPIGRLVKAATARSSPPVSWNTGSVPIGAAARSRGRRIMADVRVEGRCGGRSWSERLRQRRA
ncbi:hypothetical protein WR25_16464 [Diploscapter pachys]|uniref:Uncharacterized protein n=1 Tax=Diploscapter pachys TaxID=2018661 RepID=A0A2A2M3A8_9BILA|nr:hypothetical protein WR25_16464 [Diploscapter pachys]